MTGTLLAIHITAHEGGDLLAPDSATLETSRGIVGDRYYGGEVHCNVTLVQEEFILDTTAELGCEYQPGITRRNLTVRGIDLNALIGQRFRVGETLLEGTELCEPCGQMNRTIAPGARDLLKERCGIRATVLQGGSIAVGDTITLVEAPASIPQPR